MGILITYYLIGTYPTKSGHSTHMGHEGGAYPTYGDLGGQGRA